MKIKFLATGIAPDFYTITNETITAHVGDITQVYDFSGMPEGATLTSVEPVDGINPIRSATRVNGELEITLCQRVGAGHWNESDWLEASTYNPDEVYVQFDSTKSFSGTPVVYTKQGKMNVEVTNG